MVSPFLDVPFLKKVSKNRFSEPRLDTSEKNAPVGRNGALRGEKEKN